MYVEVLQIRHCYREGRLTVPLLAVPTLPAKIRHGEITTVQIAISLIFRDRAAELLHDGLDDAWRDNNTPLVVEAHVHLANPVNWSNHLTDGV